MRHPQAHTSTSAPQAQPNAIRKNRSTALSRAVDVPHYATPKPPLSSSRIVPIVATPRLLDPHNEYYRGLYRRSVSFIANILVRRPPTCAPDPLLPVAT